MNLENNERRLFGKNYPFFKQSLVWSEDAFWKLWYGLRVAREIAWPLRLKPNDTVLDIGSNIGTLGNYLRNIGVRTYGVDINHDALKEGKLRHGNKGTVSSCAFSWGLPFSDSTFDYVVSFDVLEHLPDEERLRETLDEMSRVLKGNQMVHKITVLEDPDIDRDLTHRLKWPVKKWIEFFESNGWRVMTDTTMNILSFNRREGFHQDKYFGYFLLKKKS